MSYKDIIQTACAVVIAAAVILQFVYDRGPFSPPSRSETRGAAIALMRSAGNFLNDAETVQMMLARAGDMNELRAKLGEAKHRFEAAEERLQDEQEALFVMLPGLSNLNFMLVVSSGVKIASIIDRSEHELTFAVTPTEITGVLSRLVDELGRRNAEMRTRYNQVKFCSMPKVLEDRLPALHHAVICTAPI